MKSLVSWNKIPEGKRRHRLRAFVGSSLTTMLGEFYKKASENDILEMHGYLLTDALRRTFESSLAEHNIRLLTFDVSSKHAPWDSMKTLGRSPFLSKVRYLCAKALGEPLVVSNPKAIHKLLGYERGLDKFWKGSEMTTWRPIVPQHSVTFHILIKEPLTSFILNKTVVVNRRCVISAEGDI